jgi:hypothetical protein
MKLKKISVAAAIVLTAACQTQSVDIKPSPVTEGDDIVGVVAGPKGPEVGVWVIAETNDLPTKYTKIVVTDERGRYAIPDLPRVRYSVWVRGYGLVDSAKVPAQPGQTLNLYAGREASPREAAEIYPSMYWFSLLKVPAASEFPLGPVQSQPQWLNTIKQGACQSCHALGTPGMRRVPELFSKGKTSHEAWRMRLRAGSAQSLMARDITALQTERAIANFADWTDRIARGELPFDQPRRPEGIERNLVITMWDYLRPEFYLHDVVSTDRRNPRVNPEGAVYGSPEDSTDIVPIVDPRTHRALELLHPVRDPKTPSVRSNPYGVSAYWGDKPYWEGRTLNHNPMMDERGRTWFTSRISPDPNPDWCKGGDHPSAKAFPLTGNANRHLSYYEPRTNTWTLIRTCFPTHHLNFGKDNVLWTSPGVVGPNVIGWFDRKVFEQSNDERRAQGWTPFIVDTNGDGKRGEWVAHDQPLDPKKDKQLRINHYSVAVSPADGSVWGTVLGYPGAIIRVVPGPNPVQTALTEIYEPPLPGYGPRGGDIDAEGVFWVALSSGHLGQFDRSKCRVTNGPTATGKHCPEGWTLHQFPGPQLRDVKDPGSAETSYYVWVDWFNVLGLGRNVPIAMGNGSDSIMPFVNGKFVVLRLPYPSGLFPKNVDGRIDDEALGWKGRGLWTTSGSRTNFHLEGGKENRPKAIKLQLRPDPLAR